MSDIILDIENMAPPLVNYTYSDYLAARSNHVSKCLLQYEGDWGEYLDSLDMFYSVMLWPRDMRKLVYGRKLNYVERFTLMWFLMSNGLEPKLAIEYATTPCSEYTASNIYHFVSLANSFIKNPNKYKSISI